jgi:hypothetical protein
MPAPPMMNIDNQDRSCACHRPVGTRGGGGDGRGPCACPGSHTIHQHEGRIPRRTGTRPPRPLHPSPCPYRTRGSVSALTGFGRQHSLSACFRRRWAIGRSIGGAPINWAPTVYDRCWLLKFIIGAGRDQFGPYFSPKWTETHLLRYDECTTYGPIKIAQATLLRVEVPGWHRPAGPGRPARRWARCGRD